MTFPTAHVSKTSIAERISQLPAEKRALLQQRVESRSPRGFELVARSLCACGITHIYGVAGQPTEQLLPACLAEGIRPIGVYHQTSAVCMALAHNYQAGGLVASTLVSAGPAVTNAVTGLLVARDNGWPAIVLGGSRSSFQQFESVPMIRHLTKHAMSVPSTDMIRPSIQQACRIAMSDRPGPVYLDLHEDVLAGRDIDSQTRSTDFLAWTPSRPTATDAEVDRIATALISARRPALLLGKGIRWTVIPEQLQELIETLGIPFITSPMGRGFVPDDHPQCCNRARTTLQSKADVVLMLGARLNWVFRHGIELSREASVFRVDIQKEEADGSVIDHTFVQGDAGDCVHRLLVEVKSRNADLAEDCRRGELGQWHNELRLVGSESRRLLETQMNLCQQPMSAFRMMNEIRDALPRDAICVTEGNVSMIAAQQVIPAFLPASRMDAGTNACMGVGIPFAIGAKVARPDRPVVAVVGDYAFSLSAMELEVCIRHKIPIIVVVANNQGNNGATKQKAYFPADDSELITMFQPGIKYDRIMKMFGGEGVTICDPEMLKPALKSACKANVASCINVVIDPHTPLPNAWGEEGSWKDGAQ